MGLSNASAIVTGGAGGFGSATVCRIAQMGAKVVIADVSDEEGRRAGQGGRRRLPLRATGRDVLGRHGDAGRPRVRSGFIGTETRADQIESGDSVILECAEQVLFDDLHEVAGLLHAEPVEDLQAIANRLAARTNELEFLCVAEPGREPRRCGLRS